MGFQHYNLTITAAARRLSDALTIPPGAPLAAMDVPLRAITLQGNTDSAAMHIGGDNTVSATVWGVRIPAAAGGIPAAPITFGPFSNSGPIKLSDFWVFGTANDILHISVIPY